MATQTRCLGQTDDPELISDTQGQCARCEFIGQVYWMNDEPWIIKHSPVFFDRDNKIKQKVKP